MKQSQRQPSMFFNLILFMGLVVLWIAFAPVKIGGQASYVMVNGISMEPGYHTGDLVLVRKAQTYQVGDVVTYRDGEMGAYVIHRIIGIEQGQFILKGDNNSWIDPYHPTHAEIAGKQWIHAPKAGRAMQWLRKPINLSLTIALLGGVLMSSLVIKPSSRQKGKNRPSPSMGGTLEGILYMLGFLFLGFLGLSIFAFTRPLTRTAEAIPYQQDSHYFYSATGTPGVYDTEMVRTGEPVFPKLTCFLNVGFTYNILGNQVQDISGNHQMVARIMDEQSGWQRTIPIIPQTAFTGNSYLATANLDLCQLVSLVNLVENETGLHTNTYTVEIVTDVAFTGHVAGQSIADTFAPTLAFKFDKVHLYLASTNESIDPMHITKQGLAGNSNIQTNTLPLLGWTLPIGSLRVFALLGLGLSLSGLVIMGLGIFNTARQSEEALIRLRYGSRLMDVYERSLDTSMPVIDVTSIDDLAKMAEHQNTMIMHMTINLLHYYLVQGNGTMYRFVFSARKHRSSENEPASQAVLGYIPTQDRYIEDSLQPVPENATGYIINIEQVKAPSMQPVDRQILKRIRF